MSSFKFIEVKFEQLKTDVNNFIRDTYNKAGINLSPADPYGHILQTLEMIFSSSMLYLKNVTSQFDINNPTNNNAKMIRALARVGGYNPSRAISATGTIALQLLPGIDIATEIPGSKLTILNGTKITNKSNGLEYFIDLGGAEKATYNLEHNKKIFIPVVQGRVETQTFTGRGEKNQSFNINLPSGQSVEQFRTTLTVDGQFWNNVEHLFDMLPDEEAWYGRTGIEGGLDVYFGTGNFGMIPGVGDEIEVRYVVSDGSLGNIPHLLVNDWTFVDDVYDGFGVSVDVESNFNIFIENEISLGGDSETPQFTKQILPYVSRNFVLARPEQYIFMLSRLNVFSQIDAFTTEKGTENDNEDTSDDSVVYLFLIPNIALFTTGGNSYFDLSLNAFILEDAEKQKIAQYIRTQGTLAVGTSLKILDPVIRKYVLNVFVRIFDDAIEDNVRSEILDATSDYFINLERRGRIPKSDIIRVIEDIDGVDSVSVEFISNANEEYHLEFEKFKTSVMMDNPNVNPDEIVMEGYEPNRVIGLDPLLGDIVYTKNELPMIRGGWETRDGVFYNETPQTRGLGSVNISINQQRSKRKLF
jgi:hypothetical protein